LSSVCKILGLGKSSIVLLAGVVLDLRQERKGSVLLFELHSSVREGFATLSNFICRLRHRRKFGNLCQVPFCLKNFWGLVVHLVVVLHRVLGLECGVGLRLVLKRIDVGA
jgi:hypothetical protein